MAKDVITRFKLETTQYDSKLKTAARELADFGKTAKSSGRDFNEFTRKQVEAARGLGSMATSATNAKQKTKELVGAFNDLARSYNQLTDAQKQSDFGKAMSHSLTELQRRIRETKQEMQGMSGGGGMGGLLGGKGGGIGGMLQVFGGNLMTKAAGYVAQFVGEMGEAVKQGIELARQGEGIRNAFERLGRGDLLDGLREATHGTVTDLELMKAAVKFNDFKLPVEELGTMLAFAQQKAKDTGQSVDYMVDSIVTGLGRKSLMILDNLGLSANEIKEKMKDTGDMTKAVGQIIREQMAKSGDYIETAADRATKADVELKNAMEDLGRTFQPLDDAANNMWNSIKVGALNLLNDAVRPLIDSLTEAGRLRRELFNINAMAGGGQTHSAKTLGMLKHYSGDKQDLYNRQVERYAKLEEEAWRKVNKYRQAYKNELERGGNSLALNDYKKQLDLAEAQAKAWGKVRKEYAEGAKLILNPTPVTPATPTGGGGGGGGRAGGGGGRSTVTTPKVDDILPAGSVAALNKELSELRKKQDLATDTEGWLAQQREIDKLTTKIKILKGQMPDPSKLQAAGGASVTGESTFTVPKELNLDTGHIDNLLKKEEQMKKAAQMAAQAVSNIGDAFANIEDPSAKAAGTVLQAIASIALGFAQATVQASSMGPWGWLAFAAAGAAAMATTISTIHSLTGYENGGMVKGNSYSGDNTPIMANAGEIVLTRAQAGSVASQLQGGGNNVHVTGELRGESIYLAVNRSLKRKGKGELVTWK